MLPALRLSALLASLALCMGCAAPPGLGPVLRAEGNPGAPAPVILPLDQVIAQASGAAITPATTAGVAGRAARLRARAAAMQGPVQDDATRARLAAAISDN